MSKALIFETPVDQFIRANYSSRAEFARKAWLSTSTVLKARALQESRGKIHWTSLVLIGIEMGVFRYGEWVDSTDPRLEALAGELVSTRGRGAPRYKDLPKAHKPRAQHLRLVS